MAKAILFLCTGNYYRSRFAEELFNHQAGTFGLDWVADSRALALERGTRNIGPVSPLVLNALDMRGLTARAPMRFPRKCSSQDFQSASRIVALDETEHRPLLLERFPNWADRVEYWHVHDIGFSPPDVALASIERGIAELLNGMFSPDAKENLKLHSPRGLR